jgi:hypothetical protein
MARKDLNKVMCERERRGGYGENKGRKAKGDQVWPFTGESTSPFPFKEGIKVPHRGREKSFSDFLSPLYGFLRKSVGKKWDKIYSELCQVFDTRKVINQHILIHLFDAVEVSTYMYQGKICYTETRGPKERRGIQPMMESGSPYYVHPVSKVLQLNKNRFEIEKQERLKEFAKKEQDKLKHLKLLARFKTHNGARYAINIKDVWYEISVVEAPMPERRKRMTVGGETVYYYHQPEYNSISIHGAKYMPPELTISSKKYYVSRKEQLNSERIRKLKLR